MYRFQNIKTVLNIGKPAINSTNSVLSKSTQTHSYIDEQIKEQKELIDNLHKKKSFALEKAYTLKDHDHISFNNDDNPNMNGVQDFNNYRELEKSFKELFSQSFIPHLRYLSRPKISFFVDPLKGPCECPVPKIYQTPNQEMRLGMRSPCECPCPILTPKACPRKCFKQKEDSCSIPDPCSPGEKKDPCGKLEDSCAKKENPGSKNEDPCAKKEDPCSKKEDPCAKKEEPCAKKRDPCAKVEDPCAKKSDPCAKKDDPCAKN